MIILIIEHHNEIKWNCWFDVPSGLGLGREDWLKAGAGVVIGFSASLNTPPLLLENYLKNKSNAMTSKKTIANTIYVCFKNWLIQKVLQSLE